MGRAGGVVKVSAGAGWGKTTLLASWVEKLESDAAVSWLTIQRSHNDPSVLADDLGRTLVDAGLLGTNGSGPRSLADLVAELRGHVTLPGVVVLDDVHVLREPSAIQALSDLVEGLPGGLCVVCSGREDLPLRWGVLRSRRLLVEVREKDLAFDHTETELLLTSILGASADDPRLSGAVEAAEGWAAGLVMVALSQDESRGDVLTSAEYGKYVSDLVRDSVLATCPADVREFLVVTAVLPTLDPDICAELTGRADALAVLRGLVAHHFLTVELAADPPTFRYHNLLQRALQRRLDEERPGERSALAHRAAELLVERDRIIEATDLVADAVEEALPASLVRRACGVAMRRGYVASVVRWLTTLPTDVLDANPDLLLVLARASGLRGDLLTAEAATREARQSLDRDDVPLTPGLTTALRFMEGVAVPAWRGRVASAIPVLRELEASASMREPDATLTTLGLSAEFLTAVRAAALLLHGDLDACLEVTGRTTGLSDLRPPTQTAVVRIGARALALAWTHREREAADTVRHWLPRIASLPGLTPDSLVFWCAAAWAGPEDQAEASLQRARRAARITLVPALRCLPDVVEVRLLLRLNRFDRLETAVHRAHAALERLPEKETLLTVLAGLEHQARQEAGARPDLSAQERGVLHALAAGLTRRQIAEDLHYSADTVRTYLRSTYRKLGATDRASALDRAHRWGLLPPE